MAVGRNGCGFGDFVDCIAGACSNTAGPGQRGAALLSGVHQPSGSGQRGADHLADVAKGTVAPNEKTREYVEKCRGAIVLADAARPLVISNWGFRYSQGFEAVMPYLAQIRFLSYVLLADARVQALDGDYKGALERCLQMGTFARHIGDDPLIAYLVGVAVQRLGYECMDDIIGSAAKDAELLRWLKHELSPSPTSGLSPVTPLKVEMEIALDLMQMDKRDKLAGILVDVAQKDNDQVKFLASADEATLERARQLYSQYFMSALAILSGSKPYEQAYLELNTLVSGLDAKDPASVVVSTLAPALGATLSVKTSLDACANATKAAVESACSVRRRGDSPKCCLRACRKTPSAARISSTSGRAPALSSVAGERTCPRTRRMSIRSP